MRSVTEAHTVSGPFAVSDMALDQRLEFLRWSCKVPPPAKHLATRLLALATILRVRKLSCFPPTPPVNRSGEPPVAIRADLFRVSLVLGAKSP